jgi:hypothetical protein
MGLCVCRRRVVSFCADFGFFFAFVGGLGAWLSLLPMAAALCRSSRRLGTLAFHACLNSFGE